MIASPAYLERRPASGITYGRVAFHRSKGDGIGYFLLENADPVVSEFAKRLFPGCVGRKDAPLRFRATKRMAGDLTWLMQRFPLDIDCAEEFERLHHEAVLHATRRDRNASLDRVSPPASFTGELFDYQAEGVDFLLKNERALLADDMGLGKTVTGLAALATADAFPALLVVPASVQRQWRTMAQKFLDLPAFDFLFDTGDPDALCQVIQGRKPYPLRRSPLVVCHYGLLRNWRDLLEGYGFQAVVFDEIQELRHATTQKYSAASLISSLARYVWGLSGTPIYNHGAEIWSVLNIIEFHCLGDRESFTREWCMGYGSDRVAKPKVLRKHLVREGLMLRRRKAEVQDQLPPKRRSVVSIDMDEDVYAKLMRKAWNLAQGYSSELSFVERGRAVREMDQMGRYAAGMAKAHHVGRFVRSLLEAGERVLVYGWHHDVHDAIAEHIEEFNPQRITGKQTPKQREEAIQVFQAGESSVVQLSLRTTAGVDGLQERGTCVVFGELDWSPAVHSQCEDRLQRIGTTMKDSILCYYLVSSAGHDEIMQEALGLKIGQFTGIMGDTPETDEERELAQRETERHLLRIVDVLKAGR